MFDEIYRSLIFNKQKYPRSQVKINLKDISLRVKIVSDIFLLLKKISGNYLISKNVGRI